MKNMWYIKYVLNKERLVYTCVCIGQEFLRLTVINRYKLKI